MINVRINFYGVTKDAVSEPTAEVQMPNRFTLRQLLGNLRARYGEPFRETVLDERYGVKSYVRVFVNKQLIENSELDRQLKVAGGKVETSILIMPAFEGG